MRHDEDVREPAETRERSLILVVAAYFPDSYGGAERQALILAEALGRRGVSVTLIAPTVARDLPKVEETAFGRIIRKRLSAYPNLGGRNILAFFAWSLWVPWQLRDARWRGVPVYVFHARLHALGPALAAMRRALGLSATARREMSLAARAFAQDNIGIDAIAARTLAAIDAIDAIDRTGSPLAKPARGRDLIGERA